MSLQGHLSQPDGTRLFDLAGPLALESKADEEGHNTSRPYQGGEDIAQSCINSEHDRELLMVSGIKLMYRIFI